MRRALLALALAACGHPGSSGPSSPGSGTQDPGSGSAMAGAGSGSAAGSATPTQQADAECEVAKCGPRMGMPSKKCADGSMGGPTGRCLQHADGTCGWEVKACPP